MKVSSTYLKHSYKMSCSSCQVGSNLFWSYVQVSKSNINIFFLIMKVQHFVTPTFTRQIDVFASLLQYSTKIFSHKKVNGNTMIMILLNRFLWLLTNIFKNLPGWCSNPLLNLDWQFDYEWSYYMVRDSHNVLILIMICILYFYSGYWITKISLVW